MIIGRRILMTIILGAGTLIYSGCSLAPTNQSNNQTAKITLSKSIWKSQDGGKKWQVKNQGEGKINFQDLDVLSLATNSNDEDNVYVGLKKGGILETDNGGETWQSLNFQSTKVYGLALNPINGKTLYASGVWQKTGKIFKTDDGGKKWKEIYTSPSAGPLVISITIDKKNPRIIYATTSDNEAIKSLDEGETWKNIYQAKSPILKIKVDAINDQLIYFITDRGSLFRSYDAGKSFKNITKQINKIFTNFTNNRFNILVVSASQAKHLYIAGHGGILVSSDAGESWSKIPILTNAQDFTVKALAINPHNPQEIIYAASRATYKSTDGGNSWSTFQFDVNKSINVLQYSPANPQIVFLGLAKK